MEDSGLLITNWVRDSFDIETMDKSRDGIIGTTLSCKREDYNFLVFGCYLPQENSPWGRYAQSFNKDLLRL